MIDPVAVRSDDEIDTVSGARGESERTRPRSVGRALTLVVGLVCFGIVLVANRAVPFVTLPSLTLDLGWVGFAEDWALGNLWSPLATNFGFGAHVPLAFGLSGVWPMAVLIRAGMWSIDAYVLIEAVTLLVAFVGATAFGRALGVGRLLALGMSTVWLIMPIIWVSTSFYMMTGWGFALLPAYLWVTLSVLSRSERPGRAWRALGLIATLLYSAFLDGYSFVMFVAATGILLIVALVGGHPHRRAALVWSWAPFLFGAASAFFLYSKYVASLPAVVVTSLDYFRAFGVDLVFMLWPTQGVSWVGDALGLSQPRSAASYWGDASVWMSTFSIVLVVAGLVAGIMVLAKRGDWQRGLAVWLLLTAIVGFYLALGPSLKFDVGIPGHTGPATYLPGHLTGPATGSGWIYQSIPGITSMRATYRWSAMALFGCWGLVALALPLVARRRRWLAAAIVLGLLVMHLPPLTHGASAASANRTIARELDSTVVPELQQAVTAGERVLFAPTGNDFVANHLAALMGVRAYNVGGDRHMVAARATRPREIGRAGLIGMPGRPTRPPRDARRIVTALRSGHLDAVILPYFEISNYRDCGDPGALSPTCQRRADSVEDVLEALESDEGLRSQVTVDRHPWFVVVRLVDSGSESIDDAD